MSTPMEFDGREFASVAELARAVGLSRHVLNKRLERGLDIAEAVARPVRPLRPRKRPNQLRRPSTMPPPSRGA